MRTVCADERGRAHDEGVLSGLRAPNLDATAATMGIMLAAWDTLSLSVQAPRFPRPSSDHPITDCQFYYTNSNGCEGRDIRIWITPVTCSPCLNGH